MMVKTTMMMMMVVVVVVTHQYAVTFSGHRRSQEFVLGVHSAGFVNFFLGGRIEAPKVPMGMGCGR